MSEAEHNLHNMIDLIPSCIAISANGQRIYLNCTLATLLQSNNIPEELFRQTLAKLLPTAESPYAVSACTVCVKNMLFSVLFRCGYCFNEPVTIYAVQDLTEQDAQQKELEIYKIFMQTMPDQGIMLCDANHKILLYNRPENIKFYDDTPDNMVVGRKYEDVFPDPEQSDLLRVLKTGVPIINEKNIYSTPEGKTIIAFGSTYPIIKDGKILAAAANLRWNNDIVPLLNNILEFQNQFYYQPNSNHTRFTFSDIIGNSPAMQAAIQQAKKVSSFTSMPVLICGETGTGKELFAQSIHNASANRPHPFVAINCAAIPENLLESTLFGSVKGAFTDAQNTAGLFEQAGKGTLFLDEINSMPLGLQAKILRVIQERVFRKVGSTKEQIVNCRIISSMNKPPEECIANQTMREDLYYRISVVTINVPPLREREGDIPLLVQYFIQKYSQLYNVPPVSVPQKYLDILSAHTWPGNVRELQNIIESSLIMMNPQIDEVSLPNISILTKRASLPTPDPIPLPAKNAEETPNSYNLKAALSSLETDIILKALRDYNGNITRAAKSLGISRSNLQYRIKKLQIGIDSVN